MTDHVEAAVRALPPVLQRRMAHLVMRGWEIKCNTFVYFSKHLIEPVSWTARYSRIADEASHPYELKIYNSTTLLTLLDQMEGIVEGMSRDAEMPNAATGNAAPCADLELLPR